jgi:hypothetical protein
MFGCGEARQSVLAGRGAQRNRGPVHARIASFDDAETYYLSYATTEKRSRSIPEGRPPAGRADCRRTAREIASGDAFGVVHSQRLRVAAGAEGPGAAKRTFKIAAISLGGRR